MSLQELDVNYKLFLDKTTVIYGETGTGKSTIIVDILYELKPHVDQVIVISPMDLSNHTYSCGLIPLPCIHYAVTTKLLDDIWERQNALSAVYTKANRLDILQSLFDRLGLADVKRMIVGINKRRQDYEAEICGLEGRDAAGDKINEMEAECRKLIMLVYKHYIEANRAQLMGMQLSKDEHFALKYINLNPRLVLIFDDCTEQLKRMKSHPVIQKLFYQGRWAYITALIACHTDKSLDPELKKNSYVNIFTHESCAHAYFMRKSNDLDREAIRRADTACKSAFTPLSKHQKLVWVRDEKKFYRHIARKHDKFSFGASAIWEFCRLIASDGSNVSDNRFILDFV